MHPFYAVKRWQPYGLGSEMYLFTTWIGVNGTRSLGMEIECNDSTSCEIFTQPLHSLKRRLILGARFDCKRPHLVRGTQLIHKSKLLCCFLSYRNSPNWPMMKKNPSADGIARPNDGNESDRYNHQFVGREIGSSRKNRPPLHWFCGGQ